MLKITIDVKIDDETHRVVTTNRDVIDCEEHFNRGIDTRLTNLMFMAYRNLWRQRIFTEGWQEFLDKDVELEIVEAGETHPLDQTQPSKNV